MTTNQKQGTQPTQAQRQRSRQPTPGSQGPTALLEQVDLEALQRAVADPELATPADILALQGRYGNQVVQQLLVQRHQTEGEEYRRQSPPILQRFCDQKLSGTGEDLHNADNKVDMGEFKTRNGVPRGPLWTAGVATCVAVVVYNDQQNHALAHLAAVFSTDPQPELEIQKRLLIVDKMLSEVGGRVTAIMTATPEGNLLWERVKKVFKPKNVYIGAAIEVKKSGKVNPAKW